MTGWMDAFTTGFFTFDSNGVGRFAFGRLRRWFDDANADGRDNERDAHGGSIIG